MHIIRESMLVVDSSLKHSNIQLNGIAQMVIRHCIVMLNWLWDFWKVKQSFIFTLLAFIPILQLKDKVV